MSNYYNRILCKLFDHDDDIDRVYLTETQFVSLGMCTRCKEQWWMRGEEGKFLGVRFISTRLEETYD